MLKKPSLLYLLHLILPDIIRPYLVRPKIKKKFKILYHIESCGTYIEY